MSSVLNWIKGNAITVGSGVVLLAALAWLYVIHSQGIAFVEKVEKREQMVRKINGLESTQVSIPPEDPDGPVRKKNIAVNQVAIEKLESAYAKMDEEYTAIFEFAVNMNRESHGPMLDGLFPEPVDPAKPFEAQRAYRDSFAVMFGEYTPNSFLPRLNAGTPPSSEEIAAELGRVQRDYLSTNFFGEKKTTDLSETERAKLNELKRKALRKLLESRAQSIHVYAASEPSSSGYPFAIDSWVNSADSPSLEAMWESQMDFWVQQDIVQAIAQANRVSSPTSNVVSAPVKRLLNIEVLEGYVGLTGFGGVVESGAARVGPTESRSADEPLPDDFSISPTGRRSNDLYDVRHAKVDMVIDAQRLPEFFDALSQVNFMTVLKITFTQIDEYEALKAGYVYGSGDAIQATMVIETIWLRDWTMTLMPDVVKAKLGIIELEEDEDS